MPASEHRPTEQKKLAGIFISYRRSDNPDATGRIYDRLVSEFGKARVFKDVDSIPLGQDFRSHLNGIVGECAAVLAIIGPKWTDTRNASGTRRLEDPDDFVRIELEAALARDIPVVPVLVGHAPMPGTTELPGSLGSMAYRQSIEVRPDPDFHHDATRLVLALKAIIDPHGSHQSLEDMSGKSARPVSPEAAPKHWRKFVWVIALAGLLVPLLATFGPSLFRQMSAPAPQEFRTDIVTPATDYPESFALSPDGKQIAYVAQNDGVSRLWLRPLAKAEAQPLAGTEGATSFFWSPDSRSIGFFIIGALKRLDLDGDQPRTLAPSGVLGAGTWSKNGVILFSTGVADPLVRIAATGGAVTMLKRLGARAVGNIDPTFLPDGEHFLFVVVGQGTDSGLYLGSLGDSKATQLAADFGQYEYMSGWVLWLQPGGVLVAKQLDVEKGELLGEPVTIADGVIGVSASAVGLVAYRKGGGGNRQLAWVDRTGSVRSMIAQAESAESPRVSPDGRQIVYSKVLQGKSDLWLQEDSRTSRLTFGGANNGFPVWSPDGSQLAFLSGDISAGFSFYLKPSNGARAQELLLASKSLIFPSDWSRDGRYLLYFTINSGTGLDLAVLPMTGDRKSFSLLQTSFTEVWAQFSPDGKWVAYQSNETGRYEIYVRRFIVPGSGTDKDAQAGQWPVSTGGGIFPTWRADGKELFYIDPKGMMMAAPVTYAGSTVVPGTPVALFQTLASGGGNDSAQGRQYDLALDGRFIINRVLDSATAPITLLQNWNPDSSK